MSYRIGIVKKIDPRGYAQVETDRKTVCGECSHNKMVCYGCLLSAKIIGRVANPIGAGVGDEVKIYLSDGKLYLAAAMFYLLPILVLMCGAFLGIRISETYDLAETASAIGGAIGGLAIGLTAVIVLGRLKKVVKMVEPVITSIIGPKTPEEG